MLNKSTEINIFSILLLLILLIFPLNLFSSIGQQNIEEIQKRLYELGYYTGPIDGKWGKHSKDALTKFQKDRFRSWPRDRN